MTVISLPKSGTSRYPNEFHLGKGLLHGSLRLMRDCPEVQQLYQNMLSAIRRMFGSVEKI